MEISVTTNQMLDRCHGRAVSTEEQSVNNLYQWLDTVANTLGLTHSLAMASNGNRIPGVFQHLNLKEANNFRRQIDRICHQWHIECLQNDNSAGFVVEVSGGSGSGKAGLTVLAVGLGPFLC